MASLDTAAKCVAAARILLQDTVNSPYRYADSELLAALSEAFPEAKKLRPDLFINILTMPEFPTLDTTPVTLNEMYRQALIYYMVGKMQLRDDEEVQDQRAAAFLAMFQAKLITVA